MPRKKKVQDTPKAPEGQPDIERHPLDLFSLNLALGGGFPLRTITEISGYEFSSKSTLAYYLLGAIDLTGVVGIADFEGMDYNYVTHASGIPVERIKVAPIVDSKGKMLMSEDMLHTLSEYLLEDDLTAALVDSVGAIYSVSEEEGKPGEGRVGERARIIAPFLRKAIFRLRAKEKPAIMLLTNHVHSIIGGRGTMTSGGAAVHYLSQTRLRLNAERKDDRWIVNGKVGKLRFRGRGPHPETFQFVVVPGEGVHVGLTAIQDAVTYGIASEDRTVTMNGKSYGFFSKIVDNRDDKELFLPFQKALEDLGVQLGL